MKTCLYRRFSTWKPLGSLACLMLLATAAPAERPGAAAPERKPNVLERVGLFFYNLANRLERSDIPDDPGRPGSAPSTGRKKSKGAPTAPENRYIAPVNPDPMLLRPREPAAKKTTEAPSRDDSATPGNRPVSPPSPKPTAPLPDSARSPTNPNPPDASAAGAGPRSKTGGESAAKPEERSFPVATPTNRLGRVKSPYPPHGELDVTGMPRGSLAKDPVSGKIFRLP